MGHTQMDEAGSAIGPKNPGQGNGLVMLGDLTQADGHAERKAALDMIHRHSPALTPRLTLDADNGYDAVRFLSDLRQGCVTPQIGQK